MYPAHLLSLFPPFPRNHRVFVAMSFASTFAARWETVLKPAISSVEVDGQPLDPHRVDITQVNDAIITEIVGGISNDLLILADVTTLASVNGVAFRNANVLYEVGIAHAVRLPQEVLLFRSDSDRLLFDIGGVRVHTYDPDGSPDAARSLVAEAIAAALREIDLVKEQAVEKAATSLDLPSWWLLFGTAGNVQATMPSTVGELSAQVFTGLAVSRLLDLGILAAEYIELFDAKRPDPRAIQPAETLRYKITKFGHVVLAYGAQRLGITLERLNEWRTKGPDPSSQGPSAGAA